LPSRWVKQLGSLVLWLSLWLFVGFAVGHVAWLLCAGALVYVATTLVKLYRLDLAITAGKPAASLATHGLWPELYARVDLLRAKSRARKKRYLRLVREVRESTGAIRDAGIILNASYEIVWFNPAATRLLGFAPETDIGQRIDNLIRNPAFVDYLRKPGEEPVNVPSPVDSADTLAIQLIPYGNEQYLAIARDVTHEIQLERTRRDFVANASHELRSPLTVISGYLDALADDPALPEGWAVPIDEMLRQANRMTEILRDLIELTRLESADAKAKAEFVSVRELLTSIVGEFRSRKKLPAIELELKSDVALLGSETELHSVFYNIISNAVRFTSESGHIVVTWSGDKSGAVFEVVDTGIGIPQELIPRLTERFYRVDTTRSRATGGTGLGLAIVKHVLQRHEAILEIESEEGSGSTFRCRFPANRVVARESSRSAVV
jgi:two-component system phosphate regulon sensor histidine kinase PhoR